MTRTTPISVPTSTNVNDARELLKNSGKTTIFVEDPSSSSKLQKILKLSDVIGKKKSDTIQSFVTTLEDVNSVDEDEEIRPMLNSLASRPITLVKDKNQTPVGVISSTDIERYLNQL
jgi:predicted transcriptional regulator